MKIDGMNSIQGTVGSTERVQGERPVYQPQVKKAPAPEQVVQTDVSVKEAVEGHQEVINDEMLDKAIEVANKTLAKHNNFIERSVHDVTKTVMYVMKDTQTDEVIKEFPPKKIQDMIAKMWEIAGLFVDEKA